MPRIETPVTIDHHDEYDEGYDVTPNAASLIQWRCTCKDQSNVFRF